MPGRRVTVRTGLYGDPAGTLETRGSTKPHGAALALEWSGLDPRLGFRSAGRWGAEALGDMLRSAGAMLDRMAAAIESLPAGMPIAVSLPTLPLAPLFHAPGWQFAQAELALQHRVLEFAARIAERRGCMVANPSRIAEVSPQGSRFDLKSDLFTGLPYTISHAAAVAEALSRGLAGPPPKKGLITDLDDTLWYGLVGEIGPAQVAWDLASHRQLHGLYQKLLAALAE